MADHIPKITKSVVITARNMIEQYGHAHGAYESAEGCLCTYGAFCRAFRPDERAGDTIDDIMPYIRYPVARLFGQIDASEVYHWNDTSDLSAVLAEFDKVIASMPDEEQPA